MWKNIMLMKASLTLIASIYELYLNQGSSWVVFLKAHIECAFFYCHNLLAIVVILDYLAIVVIVVLVSP